MRKPARRKCKVCNEWFVPQYNDIRIRWCCPEHGAILAMEQRAKDKAKEAAKRIKAQKEAEKEGRKHRQERRIALKTKSQWDKEAQAAFNRYIRIRDEGRPCISCGAPLSGSDNYITGSAIDASHYRSRGAASHLKFNLFNVHASCTRCNRQLSGNAVEYRIRLIERIGPALVERLESDNTSRRFDIPYLQRIKSIFTRKARQLEKRRARQQEHAA